MFSLRILKRISTVLSMLLGVEWKPAIGDTTVQVYRNHDREPIYYALSHNPICLFYLTLQSGPCPIFFSGVQPSKDAGHCHVAAAFASGLTP